MRRIYSVNFRVQYLTKGKKNPWWEERPEPISVLANGDAREAVKKVERHVLRKPVIWTDEEGKKAVDVPVAFRLNSVEIEAEADIS